MIYIIGYYGHSNVGDEQYKYTFPIIYKNPIFIDIDCIDTSIFKKDDLIILGGGDVLCDYFLDPLQKLTEFNIIAVSVGIPFPSILNTKKLDIFRYIYFRNKIDLRLYKFFNTNASYIPDLSYLMHRDPKRLISIDHRKIVCISLCYLPKNFETFVGRLLEEKYRVIFLPLNKNKRNIKENDYIGGIEGTETINEEDPVNVFTIISQSYVVMSMRFHGCMFAIHNNIPYISMHNTRKILNLNKENDYIYHTTDNFYDTFKKVETDYQLITQKLLKISTVYLNSISQMEGKITEIKKDIYNYIRNKGYKNMWDLDDNAKQVVVNFVSYRITGFIDSKYNYGLLEKMFKEAFNFYEEMKWIVIDFEHSQSSFIKSKSPGGLFNMTYKPGKEKETNVHRSGWEFVKKSLDQFNDPDSNILLDLSIDETFHWNYELFKLTGTIPYRKQWYGFVHHTFDESFSEYNSTVLINNEDFIESLKTCRGIIVMSDYLRNIFSEKLPNVNIIRIYHPTEECQLKFSISRFISNKERMVVNVGTWLRDIYHFYDSNFKLIDDYGLFKIFNKEMELKKSILVGYYKNNYIPSDTFLENLENFLITEQYSEHPCKHPHSDNKNKKDKLYNNWYKHFLEDMRQKINSVKVLPYIDNQDYDSILSKNIVFIKLVDASAINTLIECVMRNTPIIINKHPAVVEILGDKYPLYFKNNYVINLKDIKKASNYLIKLDKTKIKINTFITEIKKLF